MTELHFPWLELAILLPLVGAVVVAMTGSAERARRWTLAILGLSLLGTIAAWVDFERLRAGDRFPRQDLQQGPFFGLPLRRQEFRRVQGPFALDLVLQEHQAVEDGLGARRAAGDISTATYYAPKKYDVFDLGGEYRFSKTLRLQAYVTNLFDKKYWRWADVAGVASNSPVLDAFTA